MALNIKNKRVEALVDEIARLTGETKTEAIRRALEERRARLRYRIDPARRRARLEAFLEREVWTRMPPDQIGRAPDRAERERILGYDEHGV